MIDPVTAIAVISGTVKAIDTIAKTTKNISAIHGNLKKLSEAYCDLREYGRQEPEKPSLLKKVTQKKLTAGGEAIDQLMIERKLKEIDKDLKHRMVWGDLNFLGLDFYNKYIALRSQIQKAREREIYLKKRKQKEFIYKSKLLTALAVLLAVLGYLISILWSMIEEVSK